MPRPDSDWIACHKCDRGGCGNAVDKCSCGWQVTAPSVKGCFLGTPIVGEPVRPPNVSRSKRRYLKWLRGEFDMSFGEFVKNEKKLREYALERGWTW